MTTSLQIAQMAALPVAPADAGGPQWVHLLPAAGQPVRTRDGRGPYRIEDAAAVVAASLEDLDTMVLDENHATDIAAPQGASAPARGWFKDLQARPDGIWGLVEPTPEGRQLIETRAYRHLSPVIGHSADGTIRRVLRASLVNRPNLRGLTALNHEEHMSLSERLVELLGLNAAAGEAEVVAAVTSLTAGANGEVTALQSQLAEIGTALGTPDGDAAAILAAARQAAAGDAATITALQAELAEVGTSLQAMKADQAREKASTFIDGEIRRGRVGVKPLRDHYITRHMADAAAVEKEIGALPCLTGTGATSALPPEEVATHQETSPRELAAKATSHQKQAAANGQTITYAAAVRAVQGGAQ